MLDYRLQQRTNINPTWDLSRVFGNILKVKYLLQNKEYYDRIWRDVEYPFSGSGASQRLHLFHRNLISISLQPVRRARRVIG